MPYLKRWISHAEQNQCGKITIEKLSVFHHSIPVRAVGNSRLTTLARLGRTDYNPSSSSSSTSSVLALVKKQVILFFLFTIVISFNCCVFIRTFPCVQKNLQKVYRKSFLLHRTQINLKIIPKH